MTVLTAARSALFTTLLHDMRRITGVDAVMGALVAADSDHFVIDQLVGVTTKGLHNLRVAIGTGLGGKAMALHRPMQVPDYCRAGGISHEYDPAVRREQIRAAFAVPIRVPAPGGLRAPGVSAISAITPGAGYISRCSPRPAASKCLFPDRLVGRFDRTRLVVDRCSETGPRCRAAIDGRRRVLSLAAVPAYGQAPTSSRAIRGSRSCAETARAAVPVPHGRIRQVMSSLGRRPVIR